MALVANDWPGKDQGKWSPEAQEIRRNFFAEFRRDFDALMKRLGYREIARKAGKAGGRGRKREA